MYRRILRSSVERRRWGLIAFAALLTSAGLGLWADVPGPRSDRKVRVESFRPQGTTDLAASITIKFSKSMVPPDSLMRPTGIIPVHITPDIAGLARWTATDLLTIYPSRPLRPSTEYRATVRAGGSFVNGNAMGRDQEFSFRTPSLSIEVSRYRAQPGSQASGSPGV